MGKTFPKLQRYNIPSTVHRYKIGGKSFKNGSETQVEAKLPSFPWYFCPPSFLNQIAFPTMFFHPFNKFCHFLQPRFDFFFTLYCYHFDRWKYLRSFKPKTFVTQLVWSLAEVLRFIGMTGLDRVTRGHPAEILLRRLLPLLNQSLTQMALGHPGSSK